MHEGPKEVYRVIDSLPAGTQVLPVGRNTTGEWLRLQANKEGWINAAAIKCNLPILDFPIVNPGDIPAEPTSTPTPTLEPTDTPTPTPTPTRTPVPIPTLSRILRLQSTYLQGPDVLTLQQRLLALGYSEVGAADGIFGPATEQAVKLFQTNNQLSADGSVGMQTWAKLFSPDAKRR